ncbi:MAG: endonuclease/exonuclease/phosphatase family protein [Solirubrobacterales bacterium]
MSAPIIDRVLIRVLSWNLFHGRDAPPDRGLHSHRSRLLRKTVRGATHAQVNCDLFEQFATVLSEAEWDVALLQECPPRWAELLATESRAEPHLVLTSRNLPPPLSMLQSLFARLNPDLIASWEGGCNLTLVRGERSRGRTISERRELTLTRRPETRRMAFSRLRFGLCLANLHASGARAAAEPELRVAADSALSWAGGQPLILGGDFNLRPSSSADLFTKLADTTGLGGPTIEGSVDQILVRGLDVRQAPERWPAERREVPDPTAVNRATALPIRLSDHSPIEATFELTGVTPRGPESATD